MPCCVQVWGLCEAPVPRLTLPVRANVCSIKFSPAAPHMLAAGNAGHQVCVMCREGLSDAGLGQRPTGDCKQGQAGG